MPNTPRKYGITFCFFHTEEWKAYYPMRELKDVRHDHLNIQNYH